MSKGFGNEMRKKIKKGKLLSFIERKGLIIGITYCCLISLSKIAINGKDFPYQTYVQQVKPSLAFQEKSPLITLNATHVSPQLMYDFPQLSGVLPPSNDQHSKYLSRRMVTTLKFGDMFKVIFWLMDFPYAQGSRLTLNGLSLIRSIKINHFSLCNPPCLRGCAVVYL